MDIIHTIFETILHISEKLGIAGVFIFMTVESSFIPFPSEIVVTPAAYNASLGKTNIYAVAAASILGSITGALINYAIALYFGRRLFSMRIPLLQQKYLLALDKFFEKHGEITIFTGRLIPLVRQYISLPAGLARMNIYKFIIYTGIGSAIWTAVLCFVGYTAGSNHELMELLLKEYSLIVLSGVVALLAIYIAIKSFIKVKIQAK